MDLPQKDYPQSKSTCSRNLETPDFVTTFAERAGIHHVQMQARATFVSVKYCLCIAIWPWVKTKTPTSRRFFNCFFPFTERFFGVLGIFDPEAHVFFQFTMVLPRVVQHFPSSTLCWGLRALRTIRNSKAPKKTTPIQVIWSRLDEHVLEKFWKKTLDFSWFPMISLTDLHSIAWFASQRPSRLAAKVRSCSTE